MDSRSRTKKGTREVYSPIITGRNLVPLIFRVHPLGSMTPKDSLVGLKGAIRNPRNVSSWIGWELAPASKKLSACRAPADVNPILVSTL